MIDTKRLATDAGYWRECGAPDDATHFSKTLMRFLKSKNGAWKLWDNIGPESPWWSVFNSNAVPGAIPRPQSEWVDGLPPVGCECEVSNCGNDYEWCKIRFMGKDLCVVDRARYTEQHYHLTSVKFRPIPTPEKRQREELSKLIAKSTDADIELCDDAADAILSRYTLEPKP